MAISHNIAARLTSPAALLLLAAAMALGVSTVAYSYLEQREEAIRAQVQADAQSRVTPKVEVVVPVVDVAVNTVLNTSRFVSRPVDADLVYPDTLHVKDFPAVEGGRLARPVLRGRPVRMSDLQPPEVRDVAAVLPSGKRALTIDIDNVNSIAQNLRPLHRVDIFLLSRAPRGSVGDTIGDEKALEQASLFMQNMTVIATGKEFRDAGAPHAAAMAQEGDADERRERSFDTVIPPGQPAGSRQAHGGAADGIVPGRAARHGRRRAGRPASAARRRPAPGTEGARRRHRIHRRRTGRRQAGLDPGAPALAGAGAAPGPVRAVDPPGRARPAGPHAARPTLMQPTDAAIPMESLMMPTLSDRALPARLLAAFLLAWSCQATAAQTTVAQGGPADAVAAVARPQPAAAPDGAPRELTISVGEIAMLPIKGKVIRMAVAAAT